jgi:hypothetical protein
MIIEDKGLFKILMASAYPESCNESMGEKDLLEVLQKDGDRIRRLRTFRQSQSSKHAWRQKRGNFMQGIRRFHRSSKDAKPIADRLKDRMDRYREKLPFSGENTGESQSESFLFRIPETELNEFIHDLILLEAEAAKVASTFGLDEQYVESTVFMAEVFDSIGVIKEKLLSIEGPLPIPFDAFETLLALMGPSQFDNFNENEEPLCPQYSKLYSCGDLGHPKGV